MASINLTSNVLIDGRVNEIIAEHAATLQSVLANNATTSECPAELKQFFTNTIQPALNIYAAHNSAVHISMLLGAPSLRDHGTDYFEAALTPAQLRLEQAANYNLDTFLIALSEHPDTKDRFPTELKPKARTSVEGPKEHEGHSKPRDTSTGVKRA